MSSMIRIVKRGKRVEPDLTESIPSPAVQPSTSEMVKAVKSWIAASRERRQTEANYALLLKRGQQEVERKRQEPLNLTNKVAALLVGLGLVLAVAHGTRQAQQTSVSTAESLRTLPAVVGSADSMNTSD